MCVHPSVEIIHDVPVSLVITGTIQTVFSYKENIQRQGTLSLLIKDLLRNVKKAGWQKWSYNDTESTLTNDISCQRAYLTCPETSA